MPSTAGVSGSASASARQPLRRGFGTALAMWDAESQSIVHIGGDGLRWGARKGVVCWLYDSAVGLTTGLEWMRGESTRSRAYFVFYI